MSIRKKDRRFVSIRISATCERWMCGKVSKSFLKECMENEETGMTDLRIEIEKQDVEPIDENWVSVDNLNVEEITATIYKDEEYETMLRNFEEKKEEVKT